MPITLEQQRERVRVAEKAMRDARIAAVLGQASNTAAQAAEGKWREELQKLCTRLK